MSLAGLFVLWVASPWLSQLRNDCFDLVLWTLNIFKLDCSVPMDSRLIEIGYEHIVYFVKVLPSKVSLSDLSMSDAMDHR